MSRYYTITPEGMSIDVKKLSQDVTLFFAIPTYKETKSEFTQCLMMLDGFLAVRGIRRKTHFHRGDSVPDLARNMCVAEFLKSGCTHMMFLDDDIHFAKDDVLRYLALDVDVVGGNYGKKYLFWDKILSAVRFCPEFDTMPDEDAIRMMQHAGVEMTAKTKPGGKQMDKLVEADRLPGGFLMIKRTVFERIMAARPDIHFTTGHSEDAINPYLFAFFRHVVQDGQWLGEDYYFSELCQACGITIWKDTEAQLAHIGTYVFTGDPAA